MKHTLVSKIEFGNIFSQYIKTAISNVLIYICIQMKSYT